MKDMQNQKGTIKHLRMQTCLLLNQSEDNRAKKELLEYTLAPELPSIVDLTSFNTVLKNCTLQDVILFTDDFEALQKKLCAKTQQKLLKKHRFYILVLTNKPLEITFSATPNMHFVTAVDHTMIRSKLKKAVQKELRFIKKQIHQLRYKLSQKEKSEVKGRKKEAFETTFHFLLHSHYANSKFTTSALAKMMGISISTLERKTLLLTGKTPKQYLLEFRLQKAKADLKKSYRKVGQVAKAHGFSSAAYFSISFFQRFGINPSQARQAVSSVG